MNTVFVNSKNSKLLIKAQNIKNDEILSLS